MPADKGSSKSCSNSSEAVGVSLTNDEIFSPEKSSATNQLSTRSGNSRVRKSTGTIEKPESMPKRYIIITLLKV